jgi:SP family xylose:H+ symportor-like MFS transporter
MNSSFTFNKIYILRLAITAALGGLLFGYDIAVISGTIPFITRVFELNDWWKGFVVSSLYLGCMIGAALAGRMSERYGRKKMLIASAVMFAITSVGSGLANHLLSFFIYRLIGGLGVGAAAMLSPMYIAEITPARIRGRYVAINQFTIVIGIQAAYFVNYLLLPVGENAWRWMFIAEAVPSILFFLSMFLVPETPRWLSKSGQNNKAEQVLNKIGNSEFAKKTITDIRMTLDSETKGEMKMLFTKSMRLVLIIGIVLAFFQQWSGINVIFFYAPDIFAQTGAGIESQLFQTVIIGAMNVLFTLLAMWLVEKLGRKKLLLISSAGMAAGYIIIGILFFTNHLSGYILLIFALITVASYSTGLAPVTWVVLSEIFPNRVRGEGMAIATLSLWIGTFTLTLTFPALMANLKGSFTFWLYAAICVLGFIFILLTLPETKGKTLEELEQFLVKPKH